MTDGELIAAARRGDADAWRELHRRWLPWVWRYAYAQVRDRHTAEDITSESMTAWIRKFDETGETAAQCAAWLRSVVRHKVVDHHRRTGRARRAMDSLQHQAAPDRDNQPSHRPLERQETRTQVLQVLSELKESHRLALEWKYALGLSVREIAQRLDATEKSVEATLYRARNEFRKQFEALEPPEPPLELREHPLTTRL